MSALTDLFSAMANKIRSKTGTATTYTPAEMASDGIDDVYDAGVASVPTPTSITPSNASPVTLTANVTVKPTVNGKAIASYSNVTPSNESPVTLLSGSIYKMNGGGKAVESIIDITPSDSDPFYLQFDRIYKLATGQLFGFVVHDYTDVSPDDLSPVPLTEGSIGRITRNGYAIERYNDVTPSNASPVALVQGSIYKMSGSGKAVASVTNKTPSDSTPPSVASGDIVKMGGAGYLVKSVLNYGSPSYVKQGSLSGNGTISQTTSSHAKFVVVTRSRYLSSQSELGMHTTYIWDEVNKTGYSMTAGSSSYSHDALTASNSYFTITDTQVTFKNATGSNSKCSMAIWC